MRKIANTLILSMAAFVAASPAHAAGEYGFVSLRNSDFVVLVAFICFFAHEIGKFIKVLIDYFFRLALIDQDVLTLDGRGCLNGWLVAKPPGNRLLAILC